MCTWHWRLGRRLWRLNRVCLYLIYVVETMNIWFCRLPVVALVPIVVNKFQKIYQMKFSLKYQSWSLLPLRMCCALLLTNAVVSWLADHCSHSSTRTAESNEKWRRIWSQWEKIEKISLGNVLIYKDIHVHVILNWQGLVCNQNVTRFIRNGYMYLFLLFCILNAFNK